MINHTVELAWQVFCTEAKSLNNVCHQFSFFEWLHFGINQKVYLNLHQFDKKTSPKGVHHDAMKSIVCDVAKNLYDFNSFVLQKKGLLNNLLCKSSIRQRDISTQNTCLPAVWSLRLWFPQHSWAKDRTTFHTIVKILNHLGI